MDSKDNQCDIVPLLEITRGALVESVHRGLIAVVDADGEVLASLGNLQTRLWYRSAAKPFQAIPIIVSGAADHFGLSARELAVISGSHSGEPIHLEVVSSILRKIGQEEADLLCGAHMPFDSATAKQLQAEGHPPQILHNNCSGKHAGMLAFAKYIGQPTDNYIDPRHPIQTQIRILIARFADVPIDEIAVAIDGCSAPVFSLCIEAMARSYAQLVSGKPSEIEPELAVAAERIVEAMLEFPEMVGGSHNRLDTDLMRTARHQIISKVGAEGVQLLGVRPCQRYPKGLGIAIKIEDGDTRRARDPVVIETLRQLGLLDESQLAELTRYTRTTLLNHRKLEVGEIRTCFKI